MQAVLKKLLDRVPYTLKDFESTFQLCYASASYRLMGVSMGLATQTGIRTGINI